MELSVELERERKERAELKEERAQLVQKVDDLFKCKRKNSTKIER
jgi:hypothetical protein